MCEKSKFFHHKRRTWNWADIRWKGIPKSRNYCSHRAKTLNNPPKFQRTGEKKPKTNWKIPWNFCAGKHLKLSPGELEIGNFPHGAKKKKRIFQPCSPCPAHKKSGTTRLPQYPTESVALPNIPEPVQTSPESFCTAEPAQHETSPERAGKWEAKNKTQRENCFIS